MALWIESTIWIFWKKVYESNPRYKSLRFGFTNPDLRVRQPGFVRIWDSRNCIFKDLLCAIVLRIRQDLWGFIGFVKTGRIFWKSVYKSNPRTESFEKLRICDPRYKTNPDLYCKAQIKPFWSQDLWPQNNTNPWICKMNPREHDSLILFPQP